MEIAKWSKLQSKQADAFRPSSTSIPPICNSTCTNNRQAILATFSTAHFHLLHQASQLHFWFSKTPQTRSCPFDSRARKPSYHNITSISAQQLHIGHPLTARVFSKWRPTTSPNFISSTRTVSRLSMVLSQSPKRDHQQRARGLPKPCLGRTRLSPRLK